MRSQFYSTFYLLILTDSLAVMTDYRHMSGFKLQGLILQQLIQIADADNFLDAKILGMDQQPH